MNRGQLPTNQLHDTNWDARDASCNYYMYVCLFVCSMYVCVYVCMSTSGSGPDTSSTCSSRMRVRSNWYGKDRQHWPHANSRAPHPLIAGKEGCGAYLWLYICRERRLVPSMLYITLVKAYLHAIRGTCRHTAYIVAPDTTSYAYRNVLLLSYLSPNVCTCK